MFFPNLRSKQINFIKQKSRNENGNTWLIISQIYTKPTSTTNEFRSQTNLRFFAMSDLTFLKAQSHIDNFDPLPDSILLLIFNRIGDVKALGQCCVVSHRFHSLVPQVDTSSFGSIALYISNNDSSSSSLSAPAISSSSNKSRNPFLNLFQFVFGGIVKPLQLITQFLNLKRPASSSSASSSLLLSSKTSTKFASFESSFPAANWVSRTGFCFFERIWSFFILWVFCVFVSQENFRVYGFARDWVSCCVYGFVSWIYFLFLWI